MPTHVFKLLWARLDIRNHRKIFIIDNQIAYIGSQNIASESFAPKARYAPWVDCMIRLRGPAVHDLQELFIEDWYLDSQEELSCMMQEKPEVKEKGATVQVVGSGPNFRNEVLSLALQAAINAAEKELVLTTPYFVPDQATAVAIRSAALRGVKTTLILPARNDSKLVALASTAQYDQLLKAGAEIYHFNSGLLHAKTMTVDHQLFMVGSANLDRRSLELNFEVSLIGWDPDLANQLHFLQTTYLQESTRINEVQWMKRGVAKQLLSNAAGLLSPLL
jgi:cardiolipin synthase